MKKCLPFALALLLLAGCAPAAQQLNPRGVVSALTESTAFSETLEPLDTDVFCALYGLDPDTLIEGAVYASTGATAEEFAVLVLKDAAATDAAYAQLTTRLADQKEANRTYRPLDIPKLDAATLNRSANSVLLVIPNDSKAAETALADPNCYLAP